MDTTQSMVHYKYGRDYLLQLRLHPFSLQKPSNLKNHDIVKDKLYLHQLNFGTGSQNNRLSRLCSYPDFLMPLKDSENILRYHRSVPDCFSRSCSSYITGRKCNTGMNSKLTSKSRQLYVPDYPMQKLSFQNASDYEDFLLDDVYSSNAPWLKQCCSFPEETWHGQNRQYDNESSSKSSFEGSTKSKKKPLPIIDPKNGKNILDDICETSESTSQESIISEGNEGYSETKNEVALISEVSKEPSHDDTKSNEAEDTSKNISDIQCSCLLEISGYSNENPSFKDEEIKTICENDGNNISASLQHEHHSLKPDTDKSLKEAQEKTIGDGEPKKELSESDYDFFKKFTCMNEPKVSDSFESFKGNSLKDVHGDGLYQKKHITDRNKTMTVQESSLNFEDQFKMNIKLLREKIFSVRQEQQKMSILKSYLHLKKNQLDESYRRMDDKKIEIFNWEYNLANKAKILQEKERRLEAKKLILLDKESKLDEREKVLNGNHNYTKAKPQQDRNNAEIIEGVDLENKTKDLEKTLTIY